MKERRYVKEPGIKVCDCECGSNKKCPLPKGNKCRDAYDAAHPKPDPIIIEID